LPRSQSLEAVEHGVVVADGAREEHAREEEDIQLQEMRRLKPSFRILWEDLIHL
jgi:hypothetical protein